MQLSARYEKTLSNPSDVRSITTNGTITIPLQFYRVILQKKLLIKKTHQETPIPRFLDRFQ